MEKWFTVKKKLWKVMRICAVQGMMAMLLCGIAVAHTNYAQVLDRKVTLTLNDVPLENALKEIEGAAKIKFVYSEDQLNLGERISIEAEKRTLRDLLDELLTPHGIKYKVHEKEEAITLKWQRENPNEKASLIDEPDQRTERKQAATVTGTVTDAATQLPLAGVNVVVKGTTQGTSTDAEGNYTLQAEDNNVLVFSFIGYKTIEVIAGNRLVIDVGLEENVSSLGEVVINAGYWQVTDKERTGNISKVKAEVIEKQPVQNPLAALQGRVPGLEITQQSGVPGGNFRVRIRGTNSIANGNDPLFIVDGVPYTSTPMSFSETSSQILNYGSSPLNNINPSDIESIEVLKDADATGVYGSRGSNGVILITTKKGKAGKTKVDMNFYTGVGHVTRKLDLLNTQQYISMRKEAFANDGVTPTVGNARDLLVWDTTRYTDWQKELIGGTARTTDAQLSFSGGEQYTQFSFGAGYHKETTVLPGDNSDQRFSAHIGISNTSPNQKLKTYAKVNYSASISDLINKDLTGIAVLLPPNAPALYDENGDLNWDGWDTQGVYENPVAFLKRRYEAKTNNLIASTEIGYMLLPSLELKLRAGFTNINMDAFNLVPLSSRAPSVVSNYFNTTVFSNSTFQNWIVEPQANWKPKIGNGVLDVLIGTQFLDQTTEGLEQIATGFTSEALMKNIGAAPDPTLSTNYYSQYRYHAVFGRINYAYNAKYIVNITGRRDGSSRFGPDKQFANFGAIGAAWIFSDENFMKGASSFLSFGKLRGSYGITGNDQLSDYRYLDAYTTSSGTYQGIVGLTPVSLSNPDFAWETNKKLEAALELGFFKDRIFTSISFYRNRSSNQLVGNPLPPTAGFTSIQANFPATVQNSGIEIELNTINIQKETIAWTTSLNISVPKNELLEFPDLALFPVYSNRYVVGEPLTIDMTYHYLGVDPTTGIYQFEDIDGDGNFTVADRKTVKFIGPKFYGGFQNSLSYKGFRFDFLFQFAKQQGRNYITLSQTPGLMFNQTDYVLSRWQNENDESDIQRFGINSQTSTPYGRLQVSDRSVSDASFIRLKNISISYLFPSNWISRVGISNVRVFIQGQNLLTVTGYKGLDPENQTYVLPPLRILTCGVSISF